MLWKKFTGIIVFAVFMAVAGICQGPPQEEKPVFLDKAPIIENLTDIKELIGYPADARRSQVTGTVLVQVLVDENGKVAKYQVISDTLPIITARVIEFLPMLKISPAQMDKKPIACWVEIPFEFTLPGKIYFSLEEAQEHKETCTHLDLGDLEMTEIPEGVFDLPNLKILNLSNNRLTEMPSDIGKLKSLILLNLDKNQFTKVPDPIANHASILILQMRDNKIPKEEFKKIQRKVKNKKVLL